MKTPVSSFGRAFAVAFASAGILASQVPASAATLVWDPAQTPASPAGGAGTWDTSSLFWSNGASDVAWTNSILNDTALFAGTPDIVTLGTNVSALGLQFSSGYALIGTPVITLGAGGMVTDASSGLVRIQNTGGVTLGAAQSWNAGSGSALSVSGPVANGGFLLTTTGAGNTNLTGIVSGTGGLTHNGSGTLTLSGVNTFSGGLTVSAGTVSIAANTALGGTGGTTGAVTLDGGTLKTTNTALLTNTHAFTIGSNGGTINIAGTATTGQASRVIFNTAGTLIGSGALTVTGNGILDSAGGSGVLVLNQANTGYTGNVTLQNGGMIEYGNSGALGAGATVTLGDNGGFNVNSGVTFSNALAVNGANSVLFFSNGTAGVASGPITLNNNLTVALRDWYGTTVRGGTISGTISGAQTITVNSGASNLGTGGTLTLGGFDAKASSANLILNGANLSLNSNSGTAAGSVTRANSLTVNTGNLTVAGLAGQNTNDVFGTLNLGGGSSGNLQGYSTWTLTPNAATNTALTFTSMGARTAGSWVALASTVGATPAANTANIYFTNGLSGANLIGSGGTLASGTASVIPWLRDTGGNAIYGYDATNGVAAVTTVNVNPDSATSGQNINWNAAATLTANRTINSIQAAFSGINLGGNTLTVASGVITADNASFTNGTLDFGTAEAQLSVHQARTLTISANISGSGGLTFVGFRTNSGNAGRLILSGANTYTGVTNFYGYGAATADFYLTNSLALQNTTVNYVANRGSTLFFGNGGTSGQTAYTFGGLSGNANINLNNNNTTVGAVALTVGGNNDSTTYSGILSSTVAGGSLTKIGTGTLTLGGVNTFTGATTVSNGTLALASAGTLASTSYVIGNGGTFNASAKSAYSLASVATTIGVGATTAGYFNAGSAALTLGNSLTLNFSSSLIADGQSYNLFDFGSQTGDFSSVVLTGAFAGSLSLTGADTWTGTNLGGYDFTFSETTGNLLVNVSAVPEPSTCALLAGLGILAFACGRRRRHV